ncbi:MAG: fumarate hydratase, partial [Kiritimatiellia bacterium]
MRKIEVNEIADRLCECIRKAQLTLGPEECEALRRARAAESTPNARAILSDLENNHAIALAEKRPLCQDTGVAVIFMDLGQEVQLVGGVLDEVLQQAVARAYRDNFLRASMVRHPLQRLNTGDNTPPVIHLKIVPGSGVRLRFAAKGGGCENMSRLKMLPPAAGRDGVLDFVVET